MHAMVRLVEAKLEGNVTSLGDSETVKDLWPEAKCLKKQPPEGDSGNQWRKDPQMNRGEMYGDNVFS